MAHPRIARKSTPKHTSVDIDPKMLTELHVALSKRAKLGALNGNVLPTTFIGWIREQAVATIAQFK